ncbi:MAG: hypothetical protein ACRBFS_07150 [Aureispira sp.]
MYQHIQLINRAKSLGIKVTDVSSIMDTQFAVLEYQGITELVREGVPTSWINLRSQFYCDNKQLTKLAYEKLNIPHPKSITFKSAEDAVLGVFLEQGQVYVCKPLDGTNGVGISTYIKNVDDIKKYYEECEELATTFMLEEQVSGEDLRIHVLGGKIVAACIRKPAFVVGNQGNTLNELIEKRRAEMQTQNPNNFLEIDRATLELLEQQNINLADRPKFGQKIQLKKISNMAQGGVAIDVTNEIHQMYHDWVADLVEYLGTGYFGLDLMTLDHTIDPMKHSKVLEINARADWLHHTFSKRQTHDIAGTILKELFNVSNLIGL